MVHSTTKMTPSDARKRGNDDVTAKVNVATQAKKNRTYPEISVGDRVKIVRKKAITD